MKLLYSLCLVLLICKLSIGETIKPKDIQIEPCSVCNLVVGSLQEALKNEVNPDNIFHQMDQICGAVSQFIPQEQCNAFVMIYGRYIMNAIETATSVTNPDYLCRDVLGFCPRPDESETYLPILPTNDDPTQINWNVMETGFGNQVFYYKVFLPETDVSSGSVTIFNFYLSNIVGANINLFVTDNQEYSNIVDCGEGFVCTFDIQNPAVNQWYYITVTSSGVSRPDTQFTLAITKTDAMTIGGDEDVEHGHAHAQVHTHIIPIFPLLLLAAVCCCCCCARRRRQCKKPVEQQIPPAQQQHEVVQLEAFPEQQVPQQPMAPGYFYYPAQNMMYVPQAYMPMHPVSAPPATEEN
jgi:hypothetical protein